MSRKFVPLLAAALTLAALPAVADAATYSATMTLPDIGGGHSYALTVDCSDGSYSGTGDSLAYTGGESISGQLSATANVGSAAYNRVSVGSYPGYTFNFTFASTDGTNYTGALSDSMGGTYSIGGSYPASVISGSTASTDCATVVVPGTSQECKKGGWMTVVRANGTGFKNQGDCVSYVQNGK